MSRFLLYGFLLSVSSLLHSKACLRTTTEQPLATLSYALVERGISDFKINAVMTVKTVQGPIKDGLFVHNNTLPPKEEKVFPLFNNKGKTAIVTGAGAGIGLVWDFPLRKDCWLFFCHVDAFSLPLSLSLSLSPQTYTSHGEPFFRPLLPTCIHQAIELRMKCHR